MKRINYSDLNKNDLIEILTRIPVNFVFDAVREIVRNL